MKPSPAVQRQRTFWMGARLQLYLLSLWLFEMLLSCVVSFTLRHALLRLAGNSIGKDCAVHRGVRIFRFGGVQIGRGSIINNGVYLDARRGIRIGDNVNIAHDVKIYTLGHDIDDAGFASRGAAVEIADYVCIFAGAAIMPGVVIGRGAVVYPGAVITKNVSPFDVVGGNPARVIRRRRLTDPQYVLCYRTWFGH
jgi:acetyltransferase-like isoleucine patch superfamily enzyme